MNIPSIDQTHNHSSGADDSESGNASDSVATGGDSTDGGYTRRRSPIDGLPQPEPAKPFFADTDSPVRREPAYHAGVRKCPGCKTYVYVTADSCPDCGEELQTQPRVVRCRRCGQHANSELAICPHCARTLEPAPSRVWSVGAPALLALIFGIVLIGRLGGFGVSTTDLLGGALSSTDAAGLEVRVMTPVPGAMTGEAATPDNAAVTGTEDAALAQPQVAEVPVAVSMESGPEQPASVQALAATDAESATSTTAISDTEATNTEDAGAQSTLTMTATEVSTDDSTEATDGAIAEPDSTGIGGLVRGLGNTEDDGADDPENGSQPSGNPVAQAASSALTSASGSSSESATVASAEPTVLMPTATPMGESVVIDYEVQAGDTIIAIAARHGTTVNDILTLNSMTEQDAVRMRAGDVLEIADRRVSQPVAAAPTSASTPTSMPTPVTVPVAPTIAVSSAGNTAVSSASSDEDATGDYRLAMPALRGPEDGSRLACSQAEKLSWSPVPYMDFDESYVLHLGFVAGRQEDGSERITWVLAQPRPANMTSWELETALCNLAPAEYGRQWRWWVEVADGNSGAMESISPPSAMWGFRWE